MAWLRPLTIAACCAYPLANHAAATFGEPAYAAVGIALVAWVVGLRWLKAAGAVLCAAVVLVLSLGLAARVPGVLLYTPPIVINLGLFALFAQTLRRDSEPLVSRFARIERGGGLAPDLATYTRNLTVAWAVFFVVMALVSATLAVTGPLAVWSLFANLLTYLLMVAFFVVEYAYRRVRYRHHPHASPWQMVMRLRAYKLLPPSSGEASPASLTRMSRTPASWPLLHGYEADAPIGWHQGECVTAARFCAAARDLANKLPRKRYVLNLCEDRLNFMLGFAAALVAGRTNLLPPSRADGVIREIVATYPDTCCLADHNELPAGLPAMIVPPWAMASGGDLDVPGIAGEQVAMIVFTSGSTGRPQPHAKSWRSLVAGARALGRRLGVCGVTRATLLGTVPPQHMYRLETTVMLPLQNGVSVHGARPLLPADIGAALAEMPGPRWLATTPLQLRVAVGEGAQYPAMAGVLSATMPLPSELARAVEERWRVPVHEIYGCTEAGTVALRRPAMETVWHVCEGLRVWQKAEDIWVAGGHLDGELRLPDCMEIVSEREFFLIGRPGDMIKIAGKRASLEALSCELLRVPGVRDGAFFLPENGDANDQRVAALAVAPGLAARAVLRALRERVDPAFLPRPLIMVDALPRNATGKLAREGLLALARDAVAGGRRRA